MTSDQHRLALGLGSAAVAQASSFATAGHTHALGDLIDVAVTGPSTEQVLRFNGTGWVNATNTVPNGTYGDLSIAGLTWTIGTSAITTIKVAPGAITESKITLADNTTGDVTTSAHGFTPKAPGAGRILKGTGVWGYDTVHNFSTVAQTGFATDTYLVGANIAIPSTSLKIGSKYHAIFDITKTAAGIATPIVTVRFGTAGTTSDTSRLVFTFPVGTAAVDTGTFEVFITFRVVGASAVMTGVCTLIRGLSTTGLINVPTKVISVTSAAFDATVANSIIGISVNGGTSAAWTVQMVQAELSNLA
jgi:hypothetical protein